MGIAIQNTVTILRRFCGPPDSANGGYTGGLLAKVLIEGGGAENLAMTLRLKAATPLERELVINGDVENGLTLLADDQPLATMVAGGENPFDALPVFPEYSQLLSAAPTVRASCGGFESHPFQTCFVCGPQRETGDGLCLYPGPLPENEAGLVVADWQPDVSLVESGQLDIAYIWAALDCAGAFAILEQPRNARLVPMVLAQMTTRILHCPKIGEKLVLVAWPLFSEGRKAYAGTALIESNNQCIASSKQLWVSLNK